MTPMKTLLFLAFVSSVAFADSVPITFPTNCTSSGDASVAVNITCGGPPPTCPPPSETGTPPNCVCAPGYQGTPPNCTPITPPVGCSINLTFPWQTTANRVVPMNPSDTIAIKFVPQTSSSVYSSITGGEWASPAANRTYTLSSVSCDFGAGVGKFPQTSSSVSVYFTVGKTNPYGFPVLTPGTPYYLNVKNTAPVSSANHQMFFNVFP